MPLLLPLLAVAPPAPPAATPLPSVAAPVPPVQIVTAPVTAGPAAVPPVAPAAQTRLAAGFDFVNASRTPQAQFALRPADIRYNAGNPAKANALLGWHAQHHMPEVVRLMTAG